MKQGTEYMCARKYAQAFVHVYHAVLNNTVCTSLIKLVHDHHRIVPFFLKLRVLSKHIKRDALYSLIKKYHLPVEFKILVDLLITQKRSYLFFECMRAIEIYYRASYGIETFYVTSFPELSVQEQEMIKEFMQHKISGDHVFTFHINQSLIAGIRMQSRHVLWEYSIAQQLRRVRNALSV